MVAWILLRACFFTNALDSYLSGLLILGLLCLETLDDFISSQFELLFDKLPLEVVVLLLVLHPNVVLFDDLFAWHTLTLILPIPFLSSEGPLDKFLLLFFLFGEGVLLPPPTEGVVDWIEAPSYELQTGIEFGRERLSGDWPVWLHSRVEAARSHLLRQVLFGIAAEEAHH